MLKHNFYSLFLFQVMFSMDLGEAVPAGAPNEGQEGHNKLEDMVSSILKKKLAS